MDGFEKLKELGSKKIASATHIPVGHVDSILNKEFAQFSKPQFFGFLSILEREYKVDLSSLKQEFLFSRAQEEMKHTVTFDQTETRSKLLENKNVQYGLMAAAVVLLLIVLMSFIDFSSPKEPKAEINNTAIEQAKRNLNLEPAAAADVEVGIGDNEVESAEFGQDTPDDNASALTGGEVSKGNEEVQQENHAVSSSEPMMPMHFRIVPRGKLWLGIIDAESHKRRVEIISEPLDLDGDKEWLVFTGYGYLDMECGDSIQKYRQTDKMLFLYEHGVCQQIDEAEFKARNKGKLW